MRRWWRRILELFSAKRDRGAAGEQRAARWLERERQFVVLAENWRAPRDRRMEIDLVARDGEVLVFVEVKTRPAAALVSGYYAAVTRQKREALLRATRAYVAAMRHKPHTIRYDVVEIATRDGGVDAPDVEVRHYENVPLFPKGFLRGR